jgi:hypothetical protein
MNIVVAVLAILELVSLFVPNSSGTLSGIIKALAGLPGVKDPGIGGK